MGEGLRFRQVPVIDAFRLVSILWVVLSHLGAPPVDTLLHGWVSERSQVVARQILGVTFCGPAAVMVFFLVSGFCIHAPYACGKPLVIGRFYLSRVARIALPLIAAIGIFRALGIVGELETVLWSVYCEIGYYLAYPLFRRLFLDLGTLPVAMGSFASPALIILLVNWPSSQAWRTSTLETTFLLLPVWLLGCVLAEQNYGKTNAPGSALFSVSRLRLAAARVTVYGCSVAAEILQFHSPIGYRYTMPLFSLPAFWWMALELKNNPPGSPLSRLGQGCYSAYLTHMLAIPTLAGLLPALGPWGLWTSRVAMAVAISLAFYVLIERPSHRLARRL